MKIVLVEDDNLIFANIRMLLNKFPLEHFSSAHSFFKDYTGKTPDLILLDLCSPRDPNGSEAIGLIGEIRRRFPQSEIVIQSGLSDVALMRSCIQKGATRFILKDHIPEELPLYVARFEEVHSQRKKMDTLIVGESPVMKTLKDEVAHLRLYTSIDVLVEGETGSGKELCAQALHLDGPFVAVNASAIPEDLFEAEFFGSEKGAFTGSVQSRPGYLESVGSGTLFIDEIQNISLNHQAKLLRVLETRTYKRVGSSSDRPFRGRVVSASNKNLLELISKGLFREDLYYRIATLKVCIPPLKARGSDIALLAKFFLNEFDVTQKKTFTEAGLEFLQSSYDWPGNVRELRNLVRRLALQNPIPFIDTPEIARQLQIDESSLVVNPSNISADASFSFKFAEEKSFDESVASFERFLLETALQGSSTTQAREKLHMGRSRFYEKLKEYSLLQKSDGAT